VTGDHPPETAPPLPNGSFARLSRRFKGLTTGSVNRRIFGATLVVGVLTFAIKIISLLKESFVAAAYGTGPSFDAFIIALLLPMTVISIVSGSLNGALIPTYIEIREQQDRQAAHRLYTTVLMLNTVLLLGLTLVMATTARLWLPIIASGFDAEKLALARTLLYGSLPIIVLTGFSTTWGALLNAGERFALVAIAPAFQPLAIVLVLGLFLSSMGIYALLVGTLLGVALETALIGIALSRQGHPLMPRWYGATPAFRKVCGQYGACIAGAFLVSGMSLVDQAMASQLGPRSNSALAYGSRLTMLILSLGASSLGIAILPQLSKMTAVHDWKGLQRFVKTYSMILLGISIPVTLLLLLTSRFLLRVLLQHGSFSASDVDLVNQVQVFYLLRIPISTIGVLVTRSLTALKSNYVLTLISVFSFILNIIFDIIFMKKFGIAGITLATSVWSLVALLCGVIALRRILINKMNTEPAEMPT